MSQFVILKKQRMVNLPQIATDWSLQTPQSLQYVLSFYSVVTNKFFNKNLEIGCGSITFATHISRMCLEKTLGMTGFDSV